MGHHWTILALIGCTLWTVANLEPIPAKKQCGTRSNNLGIYYGELANKDEFPWQVSLQCQLYQGHFCGASIISDNWVITAAHCVMSSNGVIPAGMFSVLMGTLDNTDTDARMIQAKRVVVHPEYNSTTTINDLALIELVEPIGLDEAGDSINAICLGRPEDVVDKREMVITGWGEMEDKTYPVMLRKATVRVENLDYCKEKHRFYGNTIVDGQVCTTSKPDTCQGDSGGPLQYSNKDGRWYLIGLTSWGFECGEGTFPAVYTRVPYYLDFIRKITNIQ